MKEELSSYIDNDVFAKNLGVKLKHIASNHAICELRVTEAHLNGIGTVHGAVIFALADIAFASACNEAQASIGMQADIRYLNKPKGEILKAEAKLVSASTKFGTFNVDITDTSNTLVAKFTSIAYRFPK